MCLLYVCLWGTIIKKHYDITLFDMKWLESTIQHNLQIKFKQQWDQPWDFPCRLYVIHTAHWIGLRGIRWHLVMTERALSCHLQLSLPLYRLFFFCHICHHHATGYTFIRSLLISTSQFRLTLLLHLHLPWFSLSFTLSLHPSPIPAHFFCLSRPGIFDSVITFDLEGKAAGAFFSAERCSQGVYPVKDVQSKCRW